MKNKINKILIVGLTALALCLWRPESVRAATVYVNSDSGNDSSGDGSAESPYKTFHKGHTMAAGGDTLDLTGTFTWSDADETGDAATSGYTIGKNLTIQGQGADQTIIQADSTPNTAGRRVFTISNKTVVFQDLTIRYGYMNVIDAHGSAINASGNLTLINVQVDQNKNHADRYVDGAIFHGGGSFVMRGSTVSNNDNGYVGGMYLYGSAEITNSTIYNNDGDYYGGVFFPTSGSLTITNSTVVSNKSNYGFGGNLATWSGAKLYIKNTILADSRGGVDFDRYSGDTVYNNGYNIVETQTYSDFVNGVNGCLVGNQASLNVDTGLATNGSATGVPSLALLSGSVAINAADPADGANNGISIPENDQRGYYRNGTTDMGAYEYGGTLTIEEPTAQASNVNFSSVSYNQMTINWSNGDGAKRVVFMKQGNTGTAIPVDNTIYAANSSFGSGSQISDSGWYAVYSGTSTSVTVTGLTAETGYIAQVFEYNGPAGVENYLTDTATDNPKAQATAAILKPSTQANEINFSSMQYTQMTINWSNGDGEKRVVFMKQASTGTVAPVDNTTYTASTTFGSGTQIGSSGWYAIYNDAGTSVTVTGLTAETDYIVQVFEYNGTTGIENYNTDTATNNPKVQATATVEQPLTQAHSLSFSSVQYTQMTINWSNGDGAKRVVFMKQANTGTTTPVDNTSYTANSVFGSGTQIGSSGWYAVYSGTGTSGTVTGLTVATEYIV